MVKGQWTLLVTQGLLHWLFGWNILMYPLASTSIRCVLCATQKHENSDDCYIAGAH